MELLIRSPGAVCAQELPLLTSGSAIESAQSLPVDSTVRAGTGHRIGGNIHRRWAIAARFAPQSLLAGPTPILEPPCTAFWFLQSLDGPAFS